MQPDELKIYHNPRCSKSRETLALLKENGAEFTIIEYLKTPPTLTELTAIVQRLGLKPEQLVRKGEALYKEKYAGNRYSDAEWLDILAQNPILLERPIVVKGEQAAIGRPPQNVLAIL